MFDTNPEYSELELEETRAELEETRAALINVQQKFDDVKLANTAVTEGIWLCKLVDGNPVDFTHFSRHFSASVL